MWKPWEWSATSHRRAFVNARLAAVDCSRRRVEQQEVELYVEARAVRRRAARHPA